MTGNIIHLADGAHHLMPAPWIVVRRVSNQYRVTVSDPRNANPVTLGERFDSLWTALLEARSRALKLGVPVHAIGCEDA